MNNEYDNHIERNEISDETNRVYSNKPHAEKNEELISKAEADEQKAQSLKKESKE